jgi:NitT/TauT family transport system substrate-binding protein
MLKLVAAFVVGTAMMMAAPLRAEETKQTDVVAIIPPLAAYLPMMVGIKKGYYADAGINLITNDNIAGGQIIPSVLSGDVQVSGLIWPFIAIAGSQGLPLKVISALAVGGDTTETDDQQLVVLASSDIKTAADLAGKTIAVNTLKGLSDIQVRNIAELAGLSADSVKLTPVLIPNMLGLLRSGAIDGAAIIEPFLTAAKEQEEIRVIAGTNASLQKSEPSSIIFTSQDFIDKNPELVVRFQEATIKATEYAADPANEAEMRKLLLEFTKTPADIAEKMTLPRFRPFHDMKVVQEQIDFFVKYGILENKVDMAQFNAQLPQQ